MSIQLQKLPWNILALVLEHTLSNSQLRYSKNLVLETEWSSQFTSLLYTCQLWRLMMQRRFCKFVRISVDCDPDQLRTNMCAWPSSVQKPANELDHFVHTVIIDMDFWSILNGCAVRLFTTNDAGQIKYNAACMLNINFGQYEVRYNSDIGDPMASMLQFMEVIRQMMPKLREVNINHCTNYDIGNCEFYHTFNMLLQQPSNTLDIMYNNLTAPEPNAVCLQATPTLTSLTFVWNIYHKKTAQLLHSNMQTLQTLSLMFNHFDKIELLVQSEDGAPIQYPNLRKLDFSCWHYLQPDCKPVTTTPCPFPKLQSLYMYMDYPFKDDTLFRGTNNSLEYLSMHVNKDTIAMAQKYKLFGPGKYPNLRALHIKNINNHFMGPGAPSQQATDFALSVSHQLQMLMIEDFDMECTLMPSIVEHKGLHDLQVLAVPDVFLTLTDMVTLLRLLPVLGELHCHYSGMGILFDSVADHELPRIFVEQYTPLSKSLKVLQLSHWGNTIVESVAKCAMLMAISCPEFTYVSVAGHLREKVCRCIVNCMASGPFSKHAMRFEPLLYRR